MKRKIIIITVMVAVLMACPAAARSEENVNCQISVAVAPAQPITEELNEKLSVPVQSYIWRLANRRGYDDEKTLLYYSALIGLADGESDFNTKAYHSNRNGSVDRGLFQINSCNISKLKKLGYIVDIQDLYDPYKNAKCGEYIFNEWFEKYGFSEEAYAGYFYGYYHKPNKYTRRVFEKMQKWYEAFK